ncbi:MAG: hypothetical protein Nkreftii_001585 [Candidatus Nitrospira kreftii]|uniref:Uncharacterized protein n=1 Tax=Candidatus Nitrospira kreftii TaxID=2652173 RepID=A0A7S8IZ35_9BACT|nr:MAG: hypothetical protein Nkreftii_001585 [Candidatus Nitrospira kreftii]
MTSVDGPLVVRQECKIPLSYVPTDPVNIGMAGRWNPVTTGTTGVKQKMSGGVFLAMPCYPGCVQNIFIEPHVIAHLVGPICVVRCESLQ